MRRWKPSSTRSKRCISQTAIIARCRGRVAAIGAARRTQPRILLAVAFPHDEMRILDYNRVVRDFNGLFEALLARIRESFSVSRCTGESPAEPETFAMYLDGVWYELKVSSCRRATIPSEPDISLRNICSRRS
jgi:uncharacterized protein (DUF1015 family)